MGADTVNSTRTVVPFASTLVTQTLASWAIAMALTAARLPQQGLVQLTVRLTLQPEIAVEPKMTSAVTRSPAYHNLMRKAD